MKLNIKDEMEVRFRAITRNKENLRDELIGVAALLLRSAGRVEIIAEREDSFYDGEFDRVQDVEEVLSDARKSLYRAMMYASTIERHHSWMEGVNASLEECVKSLDSADE